MKDLTCFKWHSKKESNQTGNENSLITHYVVSCHVINRAIAQNERFNVLSDTLRENIIRQEMKTVSLHIMSCHVINRAIAQNERFNMFLMIISIVCVTVMVGTPLKSCQLSVVWWMGVDHELFCATLCTRSALLVIHSWVSAGVHTLAKKSCFSSLFGSHPPDY